MSNVLLISYDNGSFIPFFPINLFYLKGALEKKKHVVTIYHDDIDHLDKSSLAHWLSFREFDIIGLGFCAGYWQYKKAKEYAEVIGFMRKHKKFLFVLGGHGPAGAPEFFMNKLGADSVVIGDGEDSICQIAEKGQRGIVKGDPVETDEAPLDCYESFPMIEYRLIRWPTSNNTDFCFPILSSRGCKWNCSFCYRMREGFHERSVEAIIEEIKFLNRNYNINHFQFADELLMSSERRVEKVCEAILGLPFRIKWDCNGRLNYATSTLLSLMKSCGCCYINYGIESLNQKILNSMGKGLTVSQIYQGVEATLTLGISPGLNFIWGFPGDTKENLFECVEFLKKYDPCDELRTIRPVTPYPGCRLWNKAVELSLVKDAEEFYETKHKNSDLFSINFMDMPTEDAHRLLRFANFELIRNYFMKRMERSVSSCEKLYRGDTLFRGFRAV